MENKDNLYKPISRQEILQTLVTKFGGVETARYYLNDALSDLQSMGVGVAENNQMLASRHLESLKENLENLRTLLEHKEYKGGIEKEIKNNLQ